MRANDQRVVVTGGAGFIGSHLVERLLTEHAGEIVVLDNLSRGRAVNLQPYASPRVQFVEGDIRDPDVVRRAVHGAEVVYHLGAQATVMGAARNIDYTFTTNVTGTFNVLKASADAGVRRVVFTSSREVYGEPLTLPVDESHPLMSINSYGASKVAGEALCRAFARECQIQTIVLRLANVFGPRDFGRVIPHWIEQARAGNEIVVYGGDQVIDFIWVGDVIEALVRAGTGEALLPPINVASGTGTRILDLARRIIQLVGRASEIKVVPRRSPEVTRFIGNAERMNQLLGIAPQPDPLARLPSMVLSLAAAGV